MHRPPSTRHQPCNPPMRPPPRTRRLTRLQVSRPTLTRLPQPTLALATDQPAAAVRTGSPDVFVRALDVGQSRRAVDRLSRRHYGEGFDGILTNGDGDGDNALLAGDRGVRIGDQVVATDLGRERYRGLKA